MECYIINPALSLLMKHLIIGQRQKAPNFSAFHWSPHVSLVSIGQHFITTRVVHLPKRTETSLITESDQRASNHQLCSYVRPVYGKIYGYAKILSSSIILKESSARSHGPFLFLFFSGP